MSQLDILVHLNETEVAELACRLSALGYDAGSRILALILLRNTQLAGGKVYAMRQS